MKVNKKLKILILKYQLPDWHFQKNEHHRTTSYDAHSFGNASAYEINGNSFKIKSMKNFEKTAILTPYFENTQWEYLA